MLPYNFSPATFLHPPRLLVVKITLDSQPSAYKRPSPAGLDRKVHALRFHLVRSRRPVCALWGGEHRSHLPSTILSSAIQPSPHDTTMAVMRALDLYLIPPPTGKPTSVK